MSKRRKLKIKEKKLDPTTSNTLEILTTEEEVLNAIKKEIPFQIQDLEEINHYVRNLEKSKHLFNALSTECSLKSVNIILNPESDLEAFCHAMQKNKSIKDLKVSSARRFISNMAAFANLIQALVYALLKSRTVTNLNLESSSLTDEVCLPFEEFLREDKAVTTLSFAENRIGGAGMQYISEGLKLNTTLTKLDLRGNLIGIDGLKALGDAFRINQSVTALGLQALTFYPKASEGWIHFFESLKTNVGLTELDISRNPMTGQEWTALADMLKENTSLIVLNLSGCHMGCDGLEQLSEGLKLTKSLVTLLIYDSKISSIGCNALGEALSINESIHEIDLSLNQIGSDGCKFLSKGLKNNTTLTSLSLFVNKIGCEGSKWIAEALRTNRSLINVNLQECGVKAEGCKYLSEAIETNGCLMTLNLTANDIGPDGCNWLIEGLKENTSLTDISITKSKPITSDMLEAIVKTFQRNKIMRKTIITDTITSLINIARRPESFDLFPLEIWLRIFKHFYCSGIPRFSYIANTLLGHASTMELNALLKLRLLRHRGKVELV